MYGYRRPRTRQELAVETPTRASRRNLPTARDDLRRPVYKSWKQYRQQQWRIAK